MPLKLLQFGVFTLNPSAGELLKRGTRVRLPDQSFQMLCFLLERRNDLVTREELRSRLWPDTTVDFDGALNTAVRKIRRVLGDSADNPRFIETVPKRGYRFIAPAEEIEAGPVEIPEAAVETPSRGKPLLIRSFVSRTFLWLSAGLVVLLAAGILFGIRITRSASARSSDPIASIAVLPFANLTQDAKIDYLSDGIAETLIGSLAELGSLRVMASGTTFNYKGRAVDPRLVGQELKVAAVLQGKVDRHGDTLNIEVDLVSATDGSELWSGRYQRPITDGLDLEQEIARDVARKVRVSSGSPHSENFARRTTQYKDAYEHYLKGLYNMRQLSSETAHEAVMHFEKAIAIDPNYALPWVGLGWAYQVMDDWVAAPRDVMPKARAALEKALDLDPSLSEAHATMATLHFWFDFDQARAEREFQRALVLNPRNDDAHDFYGWYLVTHKRFDEGLAEHRRAIELSPLDSTHHILFAQSLYYSRHYDEAIEELRATLVQTPNSWMGHNLLGCAYEQKGDLKRAIEEFQRAIEVEHVIPEPLAALGRAYALQGNRTAALQIRDQLDQLGKDRRVSRYQFAVLYAALGDSTRASAEIETAYDDRSWYLTFLGLDPKLDKIRSEIRIQKVLHAAGLP